MKTLSPRALLNIRGFVLTDTSGLPPPELLGTKDGGPLELEFSISMGTVGSENVRVVVEDVRTLTNDSSASSKSHWSVISLLTQFVHGTLPSHFFFRRLHG